MNDQCEFCSMVDEIKFFYRGLNREWKREGKPPLKTERTVALMVHSWTKQKGKRHANRNIYFRRQGFGYPLTFCPVCGRPLRRRTS